MVSSYPTSMGLLQVDGLSTDPRVLGRHKSMQKDALKQMGKLES